jgi:hypothetical protein
LKEFEKRVQMPIVVEDFVENNEVHDDEDLEGKV